MNFTETALFAPLPAGCGEGEFLLLEEEEKRHLQVLRLSKGDRFQLLDGVGGEATAELLDPKKGMVQLVSSVTHHPRPHSPSIAVSLLKSGDLEELFEHASQLPLQQFQPLWSDYSQQSRKSGSTDSLLRRLRSKARVALKQSRQFWMTEILKPVELSCWLESISGEEMILLLEMSGMPAEKICLKESPWLLSGPEGGFSERELRLISNHKNVIPLSLGKTRLRAKTAPIVALGALTARGDRT